jgi:hypothetical protein
MRWCWCRADDRLAGMLGTVLARLTLMEAKLDVVIRREETIMADLAALEAQVATNTAVDQSAIVLITNIAAMLEAAKTDPARVQALADQLRGSADALGAAVLANTPAAPPTEPPPAGRGFQHR